MNEIIFLFGDTSFSCSSAGKVSMMLELCLSTEYEYVHLVFEYRPMGYFVLDY